jgi:phage tail sheath protein FI
VSTHPITGVATSITAFVGFSARGPLNEPVSVGSFAGFERVFGGLSADSTMSYAVSHYFTNGGREALIVRAARGTHDASALAPASRADGKGIYALERADLFNLLYLPPPTRGGALPLAILETASAYCADRRAVLLVDPNPSWNSPADVLGGADGVGAYAGLRRSNAAIYFPGIRAADPLQTGAPDTFPPGGAVAGVIARTDRARGVWKAPAGRDATIVGASGLARTLTDAEAQQVDVHGVNCLRVFPTGGPVVWGARTLDGADALASEWKYLPVRRLALFLEESLERGTGWAASEANDETLWAELRLAVGEFLHSLFVQGAFPGRTPREAYFVKCDAQTTTEEDVDLGRVNIVVGFAPVKPAEFVILLIEQAAGRAPE